MDGGGATLNSRQLFFGLIELSDLSIWYLLIHIRRNTYEEFENAKIGAFCVMSHTTTL